MYRNFKVFGRSQLLLATGHMHTVVHCQSPSGDGSYQTAFAVIKSLGFCLLKPNLIKCTGNSNRLCSGKARLATTLLNVAVGLI